MLVGFLLANSLPTWAQNPAPKKTFLWDKGDKGEGFWLKSINCGQASQPGGKHNTKGSRVRIGINEEQRFPGSYSVEFWTNANFEETCNQNFSAERAEISCYEPYRRLGIQEDSTVWMGWSEKYTDIDESHISAVLQFRSCCGSGSPAGAINFKQGRQLYLQLRRTQEDIFYAKDIIRVEENVWYDWVVSYTYSKGNRGQINIWVAQEGEALDYDKPIIQEDQIQTMRFDDNCPQLRWGVYRPWSADKKPEKIKVEDRMMVKYLGPVRIHTGHKLGRDGFERVRPRAPEEPAIEDEEPLPNRTRAQSGYRCFDPNSGMLVVEAEHYSRLYLGDSTHLQSRGSTWETLTVAEASGGKVVEAYAPMIRRADTLLGGRLTYPIYFDKAGTYYVWPRVWGKGLIDFSLHTSLDDTLEPFYSYNSQELIYNLWVWMGKLAGRRIRIQVSKPGNYTFGMWVKSHEARVDKLIFTQDPSYQPEGLGPVETRPCSSP